jgi:hypothetical protein
MASRTQEVQTRPHDEFGIFKRKQQVNFQATAD